MAKKLPPAAKAFYSTFGSVLFDRLKEIGFGKKLEMLAKYATKATHVRPSFCEGWISLRKSI